ncbi:MAG: oligosaccharide flippase family protein [Anaerolineales bacterium]
MSNSQALVTVKTESIKHRYAITLFTQFVQLAASIATAGVVPRALGPAAFGNYNFLLTTAATIRSFLDPSTSQAFFTFSSQEKRSGSLTKLYVIILMVQLIIIFSLVGALAWFGDTHLIWPGQSVDQIIWVTIFEWSLFVTASLRQLGDSKGLTVRSQIIILATAIFNVVGLLGLNSINSLNFYTYLWLNLFTSVLIGAGLVYWLLIINKDLLWTGSLRGQVRGWISRWWRFAAPLVLLEYYTPLVAYVSTYLLQRWYGSVEQGHFALASKWSAMVLVFTSSALMIFWREIANAMANGERERAANTYLRFTRLLFFLALVLCTWLSFSSRLLVNILVGDQYTLAIPILAIMAYYPLQQTYGQINTAALKGAEKTALVRNLAIFFSVPDLLLSYFLLASRDAPIPGLNLGAIGVAIRMVIYGLISVQSYEWMSHRTFGLSYLNTFLKKLETTVIVIGCGIITIWGGTTLLVGRNLLMIIVLGICSVAYFSLIGISLLLKPEIAGLTKIELLENINNVRISVSRFFVAKRVEP